MEGMNLQQQIDTEALNAAVGVAAQELGLGGDNHHDGDGGDDGMDGEGDIIDEDTQGVYGDNGDYGVGVGMEGLGGIGIGIGIGIGGIGEDEKEDEDDDLQGLDIPNDDMDGDDLGLNLDDLDDREDREDSRPMFSRPPSIRKACDLCHAAKQKCSGDRPTCTRCAAGGWQCNYAPRQRRRTVPKSERTPTVRAQEAAASQAQSQTPAEQATRQSTAPREVAAPPPPKKRKMDNRNSLGFESAIDLKAAMAALDMGYGEDDGEELQSMSDEQMLESIAIDGYLADLPLSTFVNNLPYTHPQGENNQFNGDDINGEGFHAADLDQHTTSALRDAIFSLNESTKHGVHDNSDDTHVHDDVDPHIALLDLSHAENGINGVGVGVEPEHELLELNLGCNHPATVPHILSLLTQHPLEPKTGFSTPLTLSVFAPLARSLRLFQLITDCPTCSTSPQQTLPQLALLSRTTTILTFAFPPIHSSALGGSAQITIHGARLAGTGISEAIEQHIVGVVWDSWRASVREIFALLDRKAQDVIQQSSSSASEGLPVTSAETQRAGLFFQAMARLVTAMDEVEGS